MRIISSMECTPANSCEKLNYSNKVLLNNDFY
jgi:hypothetical protein